MQNQNIETFLLDKNYRSILEIIEQLSLQHTGEISLNVLEDRLNITKKTIKTYLDVLINYCEQNNLKTFTIQNGNLKLSACSNFNIFDLYNYFTQNSIKYQIIMSIFKNPQITFTDLYLNLALSKSNASVHIKQINQFLKPYQCKISFLKSTPLQGEQHQVRFLYYNLLWGLNLDDIIPTNSKLDQAIKILIKYMPEITYIPLSKMKLAFYVFQVASKSGHFITSEKYFIIPDSPYITYEEFFKEINDIDFLGNCPDTETKQKECRYLYFICCRINLLTVEECKQLESRITTSNLSSVQYFITEFQKKSGLQLKHHEIKFFSYNLHLINSEAAVYKGRSKTFELDKLSNQYIKSGGHVTDLLQKFIKYLSNKNNEIKHLFKNNPHLKQYYLMLMRVIAAKYHQPIKLLVQSSVSVLHRQSLITQIINTISFPIEIYTSEQLNGNKPDGIISNWLPDKKYQDIPFFSTSLFYTDWHKGELEQFLKYLKSVKKDSRLGSISFEEEEEKQQ